MIVDFKSPPPGAVEEAKRNANGWVYQIDGNYGPSDGVPPEAIQGAWKVDGNGRIIGAFIPNPKYMPKDQRKRAT